MLRTERFGFSENGFGSLGHVRIERSGRSQEAAVRPASPHPVFEALPLASGGMTIRHAAGECKFWAQPYSTNFVTSTAGFPTRPSRFHNVSQPFAQFESFLALSR